MNYTELINEKLIQVNINAESKRDALRKIAELAFGAGRITDVNSYYEGLLEREKESTTGFGSGIAIPHAKIDEVVKPSICVAKLNKPVEWQSLDDKPVKLILALAVPTQQEGTLHLQLLAKLSENLMEEDFVYALLSAQSKKELYYTIYNVLK